MVSIVTTDLHAVSFDNSFNISESKANKPGYHPCTISGNSARVQVGTGQASTSHSTFSNLELTQNHVLQARML